MMGGEEGLEPISAHGEKLPADSVPASSSALLADSAEQKSFGAGVLEGAICLWII